MRSYRALLQLTERRLLARFRIRGRCQYVADVLTELLIDYCVELLVRNAKQILLRGRAELQADSCVGYRPHVALYESPYGLFDS